MSPVSRRTLLRGAATAGAAAYLAEPAPASAATAPWAATTAAPGPLTDGTSLSWLEGGAPAALAGGTTFGVPWPRGAFTRDQAFALSTADGTAIPVQTWATGFW